eukprot:jgi/Bigna1/80029/fgenesh1_pg.67_\
MASIIATVNPLPLRSALSVRDGRVQSAGHSALIFQCGNFLIHFDYKKQSQIGICFPSNVRVDSWDVSATRRILAVALRGESSLGKGVSVIQLYRIEDKEDGPGISISLIREFNQKDDAYVTGSLVFSRFGYRLLSAETFPNKTVNLWYLGRSPAVGEEEDKEIDPRLLKSVKGNLHDPLLELGFNPNNHEEFVVISSRAITRHSFKIDHEAEIYSSVSLYDLNMQPADKELLNQFSCYTWGPDNVIYCGLKTGVVIALSAVTKPNGEKKSSNEVVNFDAAKQAHEGSTMGHDDVKIGFDKRPSNLSEVLNMLKYDMAEPATGLYSELDIRGNAIKELTSPQSTVATVQKKIIKIPSLKGKEEAQVVSALTVHGSHLIVATTDRRLSVYEFLQTRSKDPVLSSLRGRIIYNNRSKKEVIVKFVSDVNAKMIITVSHDGTLRTCTMEELSSECRSMTGAEDVVRSVELAAVQHFLPVTMSRKSTRATLLKAVDKPSSAFLLSHNRFLLANEQGMLRIISHHNILGEKILASPLVAAISPSAFISSIETDKDEDDHTAHGDDFPRKTILSNHIDIGREGTLVAAGCSNGVVTVCDCSTNTLRPVFSVRLHTQAVEAVCFSPDSSLLASIGIDGSVVVVSMTKLVPIARWEADDPKSEIFGLSPISARWLSCGKVVVGFEFGKIAVYDAGAESSGKRISPLCTDLGIECCEILHSSGFASTDFLAVLKDKTIRLFSVVEDSINECKRTSSRSYLKFAPSCATISPDASVIAIGGEGGEISIQLISNPSDNSHNGAENSKQQEEAFPILRIQAHDPEIPSLVEGSDASFDIGTNSIIFSQYGPALLSYGTNGGCFVWDLSTYLPQGINWWTKNKDQLEKKIIQEEEEKSKVQEEATTIFRSTDEEQYCPLSMGGPPCEEKMDAGVCEECGLCKTASSSNSSSNGKDEKKEDAAYDSGEDDDDQEFDLPELYCPMSLGAPLCMEWFIDGLCSKCGTEMPVEVRNTDEEAAAGAVDAGLSTGTAINDRSFMPTVEEATGSDQVDVNVITEDSKNDELVAGSEGLREKLSSLGSTLQTLVKENDQLDALEKLPRTDFIIDTEMKEILEQQGDQGAQLERNKIMRENKEKELVIFRITESTREAFSIERLLIEPFKAKITPVSNYPIAKFKPEDQGRARKIEYLRKMQRLEMRFLAHKIGEEVGAFQTGSPMASPANSPAASQGIDMRGFNSDMDFSVDQGWSASKLEWETIGVTPQDPLTVAAKYVIDVNKERLEQEESLLAKLYKAIGKPKEEKKEENSDSNTKSNNSKDKNNKKGEEEVEEKVDWKTLSLGEIPDDDDEKFLLQHPTICCTRQRKVIQVHALQARSRILASRFNKVFEKYYKEKQSTHEMILEKTRRIMDVRDELRALIEKCHEDEDSVEARRKQLEEWKDQLEEEKYLYDVKRARIMGKKIPQRRVKGSSQAEKTEAKKRKEAAEARAKEESVENAELTLSIFSTKLSEDEIPNMLYSVQDSELKSQRPLTFEEKRRAAELAARRGGDGDDAPQRALMDMMGGILKKKGIAADMDNVVEKEPWMTELPPHKMSNEQKKLLKEVEKEEEEVRENRLAQRRDTLQALKQLNKEIHVLLEKFDGKLLDLSRCRFMLDKILERHNYLCSCLLNSTTAEDVGELTLAAMKVRLQELKKGGKKRQKTIRATAQKVEALKQVVVSCQALNAKEEKIFRKEFERLDGFDVVQSIYKRRRNRKRKQAVGTKPLKHSRYDYKREEALVSQAETVEAWLSRLSTLAESRRQHQEQKQKDAQQGKEEVRNETIVDIDGIPVSAELFGEASTKPEELVNVLEPEPAERLFKLRIRKIFAEQKIQVAQRVLAAYEHVLKGLKDQELAVGIESERVSQHVKRWYDERLEHGMDNHITLSVPQGFVEAADTSLMSGLSAWVTFDRDLIEAFNAAILNKGEHNMKTLQDIVLQYRQLRYQMWRGNKLTLKLSMAEADTREVQLMRVTKQLQEIIKSGGSGQKVKEQIELLKRKILFNEGMYNKKITERQKVVAKINREHRGFALRNKKLEGSLLELQSKVAKLQRIRGENNAPAPAERKRSLGTFEMVSQIRKLRNIAEIQRDDLSVLRKERDRLQRKSFPMFDQAFDTRSSHSPDVDTTMERYLHRYRGNKQGKKIKGSGGERGSLRFPPIK